MLVSDVVDRTLNEWLYAAGANRNPYDILDVDINDSTLEVITRQRQSVIPDGAIVEIGDELILNRKSTKDSPAAGKTKLEVVERGYLESVAAAHVAGARITIEPDYPRIQLFNHVRTVVGMLYPWQLYKRTPQALTYQQGILIALPATTIDVISAVQEYSYSTGIAARPLENGKHYRVFTEYSPPRIQFLTGGVEGGTVQAVLKQDWALPSAMNTDLTALGIPETLQAYMPMAVAGYLLMGKEVPRVVVENIRAKLAAESAQVPPGSTMGVGQALITMFKNEYVAAERRKLGEQDPLKWEFVR